MSQDIERQYPMNFEYEQWLIQKVSRRSFEDGQKHSQKRVFEIIADLMDFDIRGDARRTEHALALQWVASRLREEFDK